MENGFFITLADEPSLALYLREGVFSQHQGAELDDDIHHSSNHYKILADYACGREGTHVFFFRERTIYYGGRVTSPHAEDDNVGAFALNGDTSPMGRKAGAGLGWDESERYGGTNGVWEESTRNGTTKRCQSFILEFDTDVENAGECVRSDEVYFDLGDYPFPLKSNTIRGVGFCPMGPGETQQLLNRIEKSGEEYDPEDDLSIPDVELETQEIKHFNQELGISEVTRDNLTNEDNLEALVCADPSILPKDLQPSNSYSVVRQAPISPLKPMQIDEIDLSYYDPGFAGGMYPVQVLELKYTKAEQPEQIQRYREAIDKMAEQHLEASPDDIKVGMWAPSYNEEKFSSELDQETIERVTFRQYDRGPEVPEFVRQSGF